MKVLISFLIVSIAYSAKYNYCTGSSSFGNALCAQGTRPQCVFLRNGLPISGGCAPCANPGAYAYTEGDCSSILVQCPRANCRPPLRLGVYQYCAFQEGKAPETQSIFRPNTKDRASTQVMAGPCPTIPATTDPVLSLPPPPLGTQTCPPSNQIPTCPAITYRACAWTQVGSGLVRQIYKNYCEACSNTGVKDY